MLGYEAQNTTFSLMEKDACKASNQRDKIKSIFNINRIKVDKFSKQTILWGRKLRCGLTIYLNKLLLKIFFLFLFCKNIIKLTYIILIKFNSNGIENENIFVIINKLKNK